MACDLRLQEQLLRQTGPRRKLVVVWSPLRYLWCSWNPRNGQESRNIQEQQNQLLSAPWTSWGRQDLLELSNAFKYPRGVAAPNIRDKIRRKLYIDAEQFPRVITAEHRENITCIHLPLGQHQFVLFWTLEGVLKSQFVRLGMAGSQTS